MNTSTTSILDRRDESLFSFLKSRLFDHRAPEYNLVVADEAIQELSHTTMLSFSIPRSGDRVPAPAVEMGAAISAGQLLASADDRWRSSVAGEVVGLRSSADLRGGKPGLVVLVEPCEAEAPFPVLDPLETPVTDLRQRMHAVAASSDEILPRPLLELLPARPEPGAVLIVLGADREPWLSGATQLLRERGEDTILATRMLARIGGFDQLRLAVLEPLVPMLPDLTGSGVELLSVEAVYPQTLDPMMLERAGLPTAVVIGIEAALGALDAIRQGRPQSHKVVTVIGPGGRRRGNFRVPLGTRIQDLLSTLDMHPGTRDKVIAGGPMGGFAQFSLETSIDHGIGGILLLSGDEVRSYSDEPCINCGSCIDACPAQLQAHHLARYAEFGLFDRAQEHDLDHCCECGLCATVCPTRRPMLQWIRLAKRELGASGSEEATT